MPYSTQYAQQWSNTLYTSGSTYFPEVYNGSVYTLFTPGLMQVETDMYMQSLGRTNKYITGGAIDAYANTISIQSATSMLNSCVYSSNITGTTLNLISAFTTTTLTGTFVISNNVNTGGNLLTSDGDLFVTQNVYTANLIGNIIAYSNSVFVATNLVAETVTANIAAFQNTIDTFQLSCLNITGDGFLGSNNVTINNKARFGSAYGAFTVNAPMTVSDIRARDTTVTNLQGYTNTYVVGVQIGQLVSNLETGSNGITSSGSLTTDLMIGNLNLGSNNLTSAGNIISGVFNGGIIGSNLLSTQNGVTAGDAFGNLTAGANNIIAGDRLTSGLFIGQFLSGANLVSVTNVYSPTISATSLQAGSNNLQMATLTGSMVGTMNCGSNNVTLSTGSIASSVFYSNLSVTTLVAGNVASSNIVGRILGSNVISVATFLASELVGGIQSSSNLTTTGTVIAPFLQGSLSLFNNTMSASEGNIYVGSRIYAGGVQGYANNFTVRVAAANQLEGSLFVYANTISAPSIFIGGDLSGPMNCYTNTIVASNLTANRYTGSFVATNIFAETILAGLSIGPINNSTGVLSTEANIISSDLYGGVTAYNNVIFTQNTLSYTFDRTEMGIYLLPDTSNASIIGRSLSHYISNVNSSGGFWSNPSAPKVTYTSTNGQTGWSGAVTLPDGRVIFVPSNADRIGCYNPKFGVYSELVPLNNALSLTNIQSLIKFDGDVTDLYGLFSTGTVYGPPLQNLKLVVPFNGSSPNDVFGGVVPTVTGTITYNSLTPKFTQSAVFNNTVTAAAPATVYATYSMAPSITGITFTGCTVACWVKILTAPSGPNNGIRQTIFRFGATTPATAGSIYLYYNQNNSIYGTSFLAGFAERVAGPYYEINATRTALVVGTWYHVAFVVGSTRGTSGTLTFYVNGVQSGTASTYNTLMGSFTPTLQIAGQAFNGEIDDFRVYTKGFVASEVLALYNSTTPYTGDTAPIYQDGKIDRALFFSSPPYSIDAFLSFYVPFDGVSLDVIGGRTATISDPLSVISYNTTTSAKFIQNIQINNDITKVNPYGTITYSLTSLGVTSSGGFTISFWGRIYSKHTVSSYGALIAWNTTDASPMYFDISEGVTVGNGLGLTGRNGSPVASSNTITITSGVNPTLNFWYHFCLTCTTSKQMTLYVNGVGTSATLLNDFTIANLYLARSGSGNVNPFSGEIDDIRVYKNRIFTQAEVITLFQTQVIGYESPYYNYSTHAISNPLDIGPSNNASLAFWFKDTDNLPPSDRQKCIFSFSNAAAASEKRLITMYYSSNTAGVQYLTTSYYRPTGTTNVISNLQTTLTQGVWNHLAFTFSSGTAKFFINGVLQTTTTSILNDNFTFRLRSGTNSLNLNFNSNNIDQGESGNQAYDEFRVYSRALSDTEIWNLYEYGSPFMTTAQNKWIGGVLLPNSNVAFIPGSNAFVGIYDPGRNFMSLGQNTTGFAGGVLLPNGNVLCVPSSNTFIVEIDPTKQSPTATLNIAHGSGGSAPYCFSGCLLPNGNVLCAPQSGNAMVYDYRTRTVSNVVGYTVGTNKYSGCCFSPTGEIILAPGSNVVPVGRVSQAGVFSSASVSTSNCSTACPLGNGKILFGTTTSNVAIFDPVSSQLSTIQVSGSYSGAVSLQDGRSLLVPSASTAGFGIVNGQTPVTTVAALSPYLNKL